MQGGAQLFADGGSPSIWAPSTTVAVTQGQVGGLATIVAQGDLALGSATDATTLTSRNLSLGLQPPADTGEMVVEGHATVADLGAAIRTGFTLTVANGGSVTVAPGSSVTADDGTALTIQPGGLLDLVGDGGYFPGSDVSGLTQSLFTKNAPSASPAETAPASSTRNTWASAPSPCCRAPLPCPTTSASAPPSRRG